FPLAATNPHRWRTRHEIRRGTSRAPPAGRSRGFGTAATTPRERRKASHTGASRVGAIAEAFGLETRRSKAENCDVQWKKVTLAGVGLLGGSLGQTLKQQRLAGTVAGLVRRPASIEECVRLGAVDSATLDPLEAACDADLIVLCTPISRMKPLLK